MKFSTGTRFEPDFVCFKAYTNKSCFGLHWCGCVPSKVALDVVANRVCPQKIRVCAFFSATFIFALLSRSVFERNSLLKSVLFMFTSRLRTPRIFPSLCSSNVTIPPDCAPRIIVTLTIFSSKSYARSPFCEHHAAFKSTIPKLPQYTIDEEEEED